MNKLIIFILISATILTLVAISIIPETIVPDYDLGGFLIRGKNSHDNGAANSGGKDIPNGQACDLSVYNLDCKIAEYLEKNFVAPVRDGKVFCAYEKIGASDRGGIIYLNYSCQELYLANGKIYQGSGAAGPAKIIALDDGTLSRWVPRDGSYFVRDINEFFPPEYRNKALNSYNEKTWQIVRERARTYFNADFDYQVEKTTEVSCTHDFECVTPGEYLMMSRCPFTSSCIGGKCTVICPNFNNF